MPKGYIFYIVIMLLFLSSCKGSKNASSSTKPAKTVAGSSKYEKMIGARISKPELEQFINDWYGTPYKYAGKSRSGVDCSGFTSILLQKVFNKNMSGSSSSLYQQSVKIDRSKLAEGDMVFFKTGGSKSINHVGVYLSNGYFVHASTSSGVIISSLAEKYYVESFCCAGRWWW